MEDVDFVSTKAIYFCLADILFYSIHSIVCVFEVRAGELPCELVLRPRDGQICTADSGVRSQEESGYLLLYHAASRHRGVVHTCTVSYCNIGSLIHAPNGTFPAI